MGTQAGTAVRAVLRCGHDAPPGGWRRLLLGTRVGGLALLDRHLRAFRHAGIEDVVLAAPPDVAKEVAAAAATHVPPGLAFTVLVEGRDGPPDSLDPDAALNGVVSGSLPIIEQQADVVVDPRLLAQLVRFASATPADLVCYDTDAGGRDASEVKSPYTVGVPDRDEARPVDAEAAARMVPVGVRVRSAGPGSAVALAVGRYYWHRIREPGQARVATRKVLLSTMKATDGFFARTNRRVSLRISALLLDTPVTPNLVTVGNLLWALLAGWLFSRGQHLTFVCGSLLAWFSSMLDGVDGELARARFQTSAFGHWLEMVCDYAFYIALYLGLGAGVARIKGDPVWLAVGVGASAGVLISFTMVAHLKRTYARRGSMGDFYLAYQRTATAAGSNPFLRVTPHLMALMTRAGFPYLLVVIALLDMPRGMLVAIFIATHGFWMVALYVSHLHVTLQPSQAASAGVTTAASATGAEGRVPPTRLTPRAQGSE